MTQEIEQQFNDLTSSQQMSQEQIDNLYSQLDSLDGIDNIDLKNDISQQLQNAIDGNMSIDDLNKEFDSYVNDYSGKIQSIDISDYINLPSVDFEISNVISSANTAISSTLSSISAQISVALNPFKMPDYDLSAIQLSAKQMYDNFKQKAAQTIDSTISTIEESIKKINTTINGWIDTTFTNTNLSTSSASLGGLLGGATKILSKLGLPMIPGLDAIMNITTMLSDINVPQVPTTNDIQNKMSIIQQAYGQDAVNNITDLNDLNSMAAKATQKIQEQETTANNIIS